MGHLSRVVFIIGLCLALLGCEKKSTPIYHSEIEAKDGSPVYVLSEMRDIISVVENNFDGEDGEIVFKGKDARSIFKPGDVLCSAPLNGMPYGLLCKVKSIKTEGDNTVVVAEPASLDEVIEEGEASGEYSIVDMFDSIEEMEGVSIQLDFIRTRVDPSIGIVLPLKVNLADLDVADVILSGQLAFKGTLHHDIEFENWTLQKFEYWEQPEVSIQLDLDAVAKGKLPLFEKELFKYRMKPITFFVGYVPIVIVPIIVFKIKVGIDGEIKIGCELMKGTVGYRQGVSYSHDSGWSVIAENNSSMPSFFSEWRFFDMKGGLQVDFVTGTFPTLYGYDPQKNVKLQLNVSIPVKMELSDFNVADLTEGYFNPRMKTTWGVSVGAEIKLKILSKTLADFKPNINLFEKEIFNKHLYPQYSPIRKQDLGGGCVRLTFSMINIDDCLFSDLIDYGIYWKKGKWSNHRKDGTEHWVSRGNLNLEEMMSLTSSTILDFAIDLIETEYDQTYTAWPYCVDRTFGVEHNADVSVFKIADKEECNFRAKLIQFYMDTDGPNWLRHDNWCTDAPLEDWYGVSEINGGYYIDLSSNGLLGSGSLSDSDELKGVTLDSSNPKSPNMLFSLDLSGCSSLWSISVSDLNSLNASGCTSLMNLTLSTEEPLNVNVSGCTSLESLSLSKMSSLILDVSGCSSLRTFKLNNCGSVSLIGSMGSSLESLNLHACSMQSLDISNCPSLKTVDCTDNSMTSLKVSNCSSLESLYCSRNALSSLDIKDCPSVTYLDCSYNELTSLDVKKIPSLAELNCNNNKLSSLDVSGMSRLRLLSCGTNKLSSLNYSGCGELRELYCFENRLTLLNLSVCPKLEMLGCSDNLLTALDVSVCPEMFNLACENNHIIQQIEYEDSFGCFVYDQLYNYTYDEQGIMVSYSKNPYGWYFPGEPDICGHYRKTN